MNTKLKCLILDDELLGLTYLKMICEQIPSLEVIKAYNSPKNFLEEFEQIDFDLCILDIEMPEVNGLEIAKHLKNKLIIFTTAYSDFAADAFDLQVVDYVRKPIKTERLSQSVEKAINLLKLSDTKRNFIKISTDQGKTLLDYSKIQLIKSSEIDARDKIAFLSDGSTTLLKNISFEKLLQLLPSEEFCRINKQELISCNCINAISNEKISTTIKGKDGRFQILNLSEKYKNELIQKVHF